MVALPDELSGYYHFLFSNFAKKKQSESVSRVSHDSVKYKHNSVSNHSGNDPVTKLEMTKNLIEQSKVPAGMVGTYSLNSKLHCSHIS